jgi:hypothetical protein
VLLNLGLLPYQLIYLVLNNLKPIRGEPMVIEWKKSDRKKPIIQYTYDAPLQMTAYIGAINFDGTYSEKVGAKMLTSFTWLKNCF